MINTTKIQQTGKYILRKRTSTCYELNSTREVQPNNVAVSIFRYPSVPTALAVQPQRAGRCVFTPGARHQRWRASAPRARHARGTHLHQATAAAA